MTLTDFTKDLSLAFAVVPCKILNRCFTFRTTTISRNIAFDTSEYRSDGFVIALFVVINKVSPNPVLFEGNKFWKFINLKLLILR